VPVERRDCAFAFRQGVGPLPEARPAPGRTNLAAHGPEHFRNRLASEPRIGALDLFRDSAGAWKDDERAGRLPESQTPSVVNDERGLQQIVVAAVGTR